MVERSAFDAPRVGETLSPAVQPLLVELGVWEEFQALCSLPSWGTRAVWGGAEPQEHSRDIAIPYGCGWHVDRRRLDQMLADAAVEAGASLRTQARLVECQRQGGDGWLLALESHGQDELRHRARCGRRHRPRRWAL